MLNETNVLSLAEPAELSTLDSGEPSAAPEEEFRPSRALTSYASQHARPTAWEYTQGGLVAIALATLMASLALAASL